MLVQNCLIVSVLLLIFHLNLCGSAQIVFYFATSPHGHRVGVWPLVSALVEKGHNVTFISSFDPSSCRVSSPLVNEINVKPVVDAFGPLFFDDKDPLTFRREGISQTVWDVAALNTLFKCEAILQKWRDLFRTILQIKSGVDLVVIDVPNNDCGFGLAHKFGAKKIILYSGQMGLFMSLPDTMGFVPETAWVPDMQRAYSSGESGLGYFQRLANTLRAARWHTFRDVFIIPQHNKLNQKYLEDSTDPTIKIPSLADLEKNVNLVLSNSHHSEEFPKSLPPSVVLVGSLHIPKTPSVVPLDIQKFIGNDDFAYVSYGTEIQLPKELERVLIESLVDSGLKVIVQSKNSGEWKDTEKVFMRDWLPQHAVLSHQNIRLIVSHGSSYAIQEAIYYRVPILLTPIQLDQDYNADLVEKLGIGVKLEISSEFSSYILKEKLGQLEYSKLKTAIVGLSSFSKERPVHPLDSAVWWTELVLRRNASEMWKLKSTSSSTLTWLQRRLIDVWAVAIIIAVLAISSFGMFLAWVVKHLVVSWIDRDQMTKGEPLGSDEDTKKIL